MNKLQRKLVVYDIECLPNFFCVVFKEVGGSKVIRCEISDRRDDRDMIKLVATNYTLIGYNNHHYDDLLIHAILKAQPTNKGLYSLSHKIINRLDPDYTKKFRFHPETDTIDLMTMMASSKLRVGLKHLQVKIKWDNLLEFECDWNKLLPRSRWDECIA